MSCINLVNGKLREQVIRGEIPEWVQKHPRKGYIIQVALSAPPWVDRVQLREIRNEARRRTRDKILGKRWVVGHILPLTHGLVCGLTVPWNLRVMTHEENCAMGNKLHIAAQIDLFEEPEQLAFCL